MKDSITQIHRREIQYIDAALPSEKKNVKCFKSVAYAMGAGVGFLLLQALLPDIENDEKEAAVMALFNVISACMMIYAIVVTFGYFLFRTQVHFIIFVLDWIAMPWFIIWCLIQGYSILVDGAV